MKYEDVIFRAMGAGFVFGVALGVYLALWAYWSIFIAGWR